MSEYYIRKGGYFYRPNSQGYTENASEAGRYSLEEAISLTHPNGPDGPRDGLTYIAADPHECDAFGFNVLTLDGLISRLQLLRNKSPHLGNRPVYINNCPPLHWPVKEVGWDRQGQEQHVTISVERGGN